MDLSPQALNLLLDHMSQPRKKSVYLVSIYIPGIHTSKKTLRDELQVLFADAIHPYIHSRNPHNEYFDFLQILADQVSQIQNIAAGVGIFIEVDLSDHVLNTDKSIALIRSYIVRLPIAPVSETYIGKEYRVEQLIEILDKTFSAYAITFHLENYAIFDVSAWGAKKVLDINAAVWMEPMNGGGDYHLEHRKLTSMQDSIIEAIADTKKLLKKADKDFLVVFFSPPFGQDIMEERFTNEFSNPSDPKVIFVKRHADTLHEVFTTTREHVLQEREKEVIQRIHLAQERNHLYTGIIPDVIHNIQANNVHTLFIKKGLRVPKKHLLQGTKLSLTGELSRLQEWQDIVPWLIKMSIETSGIVYVTSHLTVPLLLYSRFVLR